MQHFTQYLSQNIFQEVKPSINNTILFNFPFLGDLFERLSPKEYHLTEDKCQLFVRQIIQGIDYIHNKKIIHLDIKPFNILFENKVRR